MEKEKLFIRFQFVTSLHIRWAYHSLQLAAAPHGVHPGESNDMEYQYFVLFMIICIFYRGNWEGVCP